MRCPKCGYTSFDHLSECEKCSADLAGAREELGLPALKPAIPFFLESLLKAADEEQQQGEAAFEAATVEPGFELGAEEASDVAGLEPFAEPEMSARAPSLSLAEEDSPAAGEPSDEALAVGGDRDEMLLEDDIPVIEFSDDDLEPYMDVKTPPPEDLQQTPPSAGDSSAGEASEQEMVIELTDDDLEGLFLELEDDSEEENEPETRTDSQ